MTSAVYFLPEVTSVAVTPVASSMTWLLVSTRPLGEITMPVPSAVASLYLRFESISTMPGSTWAASALAFSDPVPLFVPEPLLPVPEDGRGFTLPLPLPPKGFACDPLPLNGELAEGAAPEPEWFSATAAPAPAAAARTATAT